MFILSFYLFLLGYAALFLWLMPGAFIDYTNPLWYLYVVLGLLVGLILSFITQLEILNFTYYVRKNKGPMNMFNHRFASSLLRLGTHLARIKIIVTGKENIPTGKFVLIGNHQENYDIPILMPIFKDHPIAFVGKEALRKMPIFGKWIGILGNVFISPHADRSAAESIIQAIKNYNMGMPMGIFPEGKRSYSNTMIAFKPGAFKLVLKPKADILIATQYNTCTIFKKFPWRRYRVYVHIHPIVKYEEFQDMNTHELSDFIKAKIQLQLDKFAEQLG